MAFLVQRAGALFVRDVDPLTHTLLGGACGYAFFHRRLGRVAAAAGAAAGLLPDADVFIRSAVDPLLAVEMHRGFSHSLFFAPVGAALAALPWWTRAGRAGRHWALWACATAAYASHCLLDAATSYGTRLFWPFTSLRVGWDFVAVIDPAVTLPLLAGLGWALVRRSPGAAWVGLAFATGYLGLGALQRARAASAQALIAASRGHVIERAEAMPTLGNLMVWRTLYLHEGKIYSDRVRAGWRGGTAYVAGWSLPEVTESNLTPEERAAAEESNAFNRFRHFAGRWVGRAPDDPTVLADLRYSLSAAAFDPIWGVRLGAHDGPAVVWVNRSRDRRVDVRGMWDEIAGADARYRPVPSSAEQASD